MQSIVSSTNLFMQALLTLLHSERDFGLSECNKVKLSVIQQSRLLISAEKNSSVLVYSAFIM